MLCSDCVGKAQDNEFLRFRLREGLRKRSQSTAAEAPEPAADQPPEDATEPAADQPPADATVDGGPPPSDDMLAYYAARAPEYDDWYLRRGRYSHGVIADAAWNAELDQAGQWLDGLPIGGEIVELAAGTGWWSPLLASKGQLWLYDAAAEPLERARDRLLAHGLAAHIHLRDAWAEPDRQVDALFCGFWISHVPRARLAEFFGLCRRWLKPGGVFAFIDSRRDPSSSARDHPLPADDLSVRKLDDGREFTIPKIYYEPADLATTLADTGFTDVGVTTTPRFFLLGTGRAPDV